MKIQGKVIDSTTKEPLFGVNVFISDQNGKVINPPKGVATNPDGNYSLDVGSMQYVSASYIGYKTITKLNTPFTSNTQPSDFWDFKLSPQINEIAEFTVIADKDEPIDAARKDKRNYKPFIIGGLVVLALIVGVVTYKKLK